MSVSNLWLVEIPWIMANGAGVNYIFVQGTKEEVSLAVPMWAAEPEGDFPPYNRELLVYEAEVLDTSAGDFAACPAISKPSRHVLLVEEPNDEKQFCLYARPDNPFGVRKASLEELDQYKSYWHKWVILRLTKKYSWVFNDRPVT